jgi:membrane fusion protein, multidrug efflux system
MFCRLFFIWMLLCCGLSPCLAGDLTGLILPLHDIEIGTPVSGIVTQLLVKEGDTVSAGQPILRLNDEMDKLELTRTERILQKTQFDYDAAERLFQEKIGTKEEALRRKIEHELAKIQKQAAEVRLSQRTIVAPYSGVIVRRDKEPGEAVQIDETLMQLIHIQQVYAQFYLEPEQAQKLKLEDMLSFSISSLPGTPSFRGKIEFMDPRVDAESGLYRMKLLLENPNLVLKPGMRAELNLELKK